MPLTTIQVHRGNAPAQGVTVMLSFLTGGVSATERTGRDGTATISHSATGNAKVIIDGRTMGTIRTPGRESFRI
jgi:hypothetical protein